MLKNFHLIAHRGNLYGPREHENNPNYLLETLKKDYEIEVDVWYNALINDKYYSGLYTGHNFPQYQINLEFLENDSIWVHTKNHEALELLSHKKTIHSFWHQNDDYTMTSKGFIWTYPEKPLLSKSIIVNLSDNCFYRNYLGKCSGICSDYIP